MSSYFARDALLPDGWAKDVRIEIDTAGNFSRIESDSTADGVDRLSGPALPGMPNLHSHAFQRAMAGLAEVKGSADDDFWSWRELMYQFVQRLTPDIAHAIALHLYIDMLQHGYTAVGEFHYVQDGSAEMLLRHVAAAQETGIAFTALPSLYSWSGFASKPLQARQNRFRTDPALVLKLVESIRTMPDVRAGASPHSLRAADPAGLKDLIAGLKNDHPIHIHAAEQTKEVDECIAALGKRPVEWLLENCDIDGRWCVVHATHMTPEETTALAASGAVAGICPTTEANLGDGLFPLGGYRAGGGRYGIGGDSHVSRDPAEELRLLEYGQRLLQRRRNLAASAASPAVGTTLWREAAHGGGLALGRKMGTIAAGQRADLVVLDAEHPDLAGKSGDAIANSLVFSGSTGLVRDVMVAGVWKVRGGRHALQEQAAEAYKLAVAELTS